MQDSGRVWAIVIAAALLLGGGIYLVLLNAPGNMHFYPITDSGSSSGIQPGFSQQSTLLEPLCLPRGNERKILTTLWSAVVRETGIDDSSTVLLSFSMSRHDGWMPRQVLYVFSSKKDWWNGSRKVLFIGNESDTCERFTLISSDEKLNVSEVAGPSAGELFSELDQVSFSDLGLAGEETYISTSLRTSTPSDEGASHFLLANGSVVSLRNITFDHGSTLEYPWDIMIMECIREPGHVQCGTAESRPRVWIFSDDRMKGITSWETR
ncbi:MAG: hypothetical protein Q7T80_14735 [Methanoregula sp.]|nr:hypothetical protein [Methanoregula sp.]